MVLPAIPALSGVGSSLASFLGGSAARAGVTGLLGGLALDDLPLVGGFFGGGGGDHGGGPGGLVTVALVGGLAAVVGFLIALVTDDS